MSAILADFTASHEPGSRLHDLGTSLQHSHAVNRERRRAVLKHEDLARRLVKELCYANPAQWNGFIPPALIDPGGHEQSCCSTHIGRHGEVRFRFNQVGLRARGEVPNDSRARRILLEISTEAWHREHPKAAPEGPP